MKTIKILISLVLVATLLNLKVDNNIEAMDSVTLGAGTENEYVVPADTTGSAETSVALMPGFVQTNSKKLNFEKNNLEGLSGDLRTYISGVHSLDNGKYIALAIHTNEYSIMPNKFYGHAYLLLTNKDGIVEKSIAITSGEVGDGMSAWKNYEEEGADSEGVRVSYPTMLVEGNKIYVYYSGHIPGTVPGTPATASYFTTDIKFNSSANKWGQMKNFTGTSTTDYWVTKSVMKYNTQSKAYEVSSAVALTYNYIRGIDSNSTQYRYALSDLTSETKTEDRYLTMKTFSQLTQNKYDDSYIRSGFRNLDVLMSLSNGDIVGIPFASIVATDGSVRRSRELVVWNADGSVKHSYTAAFEAGLAIQYNISDESQIYFMEYNGIGSQLKKMDLSTGKVTNVKNFPIGTQITITPHTDSTYKSTYALHGYAGDATGEFSGYGVGPGVVIGSMDENFSVVSASIIATEPAITLKVAPGNSEELFVYGDLDTNKTFANEPTSSTNSIGGKGWIDKPDPYVSGYNKNTYMGSMLKMDDYAPAINVGKTTKVNIDEVNTNELLDTTLISSVSVYDTFELSADNPANDGLTAAEMMVKLQARINRNPYDITADIEWDTLGLDKTKPGYNTVKFFVTDTNNQVTAASKVVNIITNKTVENGELALDASNFYIPYADAAGLSSSQVVSKSSAIAWNMTSGSDLTVKVNPTDLAKINNTSGEGAFNVRLTATEGGTTVEKTITVFVGGVLNPDGSNVLYADDFKVHLDNASSYTSAQGVSDSKAQAYDIDSGNELDSSNLSTNVSNINSATVVGPQQVVVTYSDGTNTITDNVIASIYDDTVEFGSEDAISAKSIIFKLSEVETMTSAELRVAIETRSAVKAWDLSTGDVVSYSYDESVVKAAEGVYSLTFKTVNGTEKTIKVFVEGVLSPDGTIVLYADGFKVHLDNAASYTSAQGVSDSKAQAYNFETAELLDSSNISADVSNVNSAVVVGPQQVKVTYSDGTNSVTDNVIASIYDETVEFGSEDAISAKSVVFKLSEVEALTSAELRVAIETRSAVKAWDLSTGDAVSYTYDESVVKAELGKYPLTFTTANGTEKTITVFVMTDPSCNSTGCDTGDANEVIDAVDFTLKPAEVGLLTESKVIILGKAKGIDLITDEELSLSANYSAIQTDPGSYNVIYATASGTNKTVKATVGNNLVVDGNKAIAANDVVMTSKELQAIKEDRNVLNTTLVSRSRARAWLISDNSDLTPVTVDSSAFDFADLTPNTYTIIYQHESSSDSSVINTSAKLTVKGENTVIGNKDVIDANDFALAANEVSSLTTEKVIEFASARAWLLGDGSEVEIVEVDFSQIEAKQGIYDVTFKTSYGTTTTVQAFVGDDKRPVIDEENDVVVFSNDYQLKAKDVNNMTVADHVEKANAYAIDQNTYEELELTYVNITEVKAESGIYTAEFGVYKPQTARMSTQEVVSSSSIVTVVEELVDTGVPMQAIFLVILALAIMLAVRFIIRNTRNL